MSRVASFASLVLLALAAVTTTICCADAATGPAADTGTAAGPARFIVAAGPGGVIVASVPDDGGPFVQCLSPDGASLWRWRGDCEVSSSGPPSAVAWASAAQDDPTVWALASLGDPGGQRWTIREADFVRPFAPVGTTVRCMVGGERTELRVLGRDGAPSVILPHAREVVSACQSADGRRLAVTLVGSQSAKAPFTLVWLRVGRQATLQLVASHGTAHPTVFLSPNGRYAVLGGERPQIVAFGRARGVPLRDEYVTEARFWGDRMLLIATGTVKGRPVTIARLARRSGRTLWNLEVPGEVFLHTDRALRRAAYLDPATLQPVVVDMLSGGAVRLGAVGVDVAPVEGDEVVVLSSDGSIVYRNVQVP